MQQDSPEIAQVVLVCDWLSRGPLGATELGSRLGTIETQGRTAAYVTPSSPAWSRIIISHDRDAFDVSYVELVLARPGAVSAAQLKERFGPATQPVRIHWDSPIKLHFDVDPGPGRPHRCRVIAEVADGGSQTETEPLKSIAIQPLPRSPG